MRLLPLAVLLTTLAAAQADKTPTVYINGTPIRGKAVTVDGKPYVALPVSELQKSGALVAGGSAPVKAIQGCLSQPLFNGVVRITLLSASAKKNKYNDDEYVITFRVANGTQKTINPAADAEASYDNIYAASADGQVQQFSPLDGGDSASYGNVDVTPGANVLQTARLPKPPSFTVTRILYRPSADNLGC